MSVRTLRFASFLTLSFGVSVLVGCGSSFESSSAPVTTQGSAIQGVVMGGQQPIVGAKIYLMQANPTVWKGASTSLLKSASNTTADSSGNYYVSTAAPNGTFNITGDYSCTAGTQVYLIGVGGNSLGTDTSVSNSAIVQMALLGQCPSSGSFASSIPYITLNELSTVAAAYSIAGFALDYAHIGQWATTAQTTGLANAFLSESNMVSLAKGVALGTTTGGNGTVPYTKLNTLADIIATCVNTTSNTSSACSTLFSAAPSAAGTKPTTTFDAILNLAQNPTINNTNTGLINQPSAVSPFQPYLSANPNDWTVSILYTASNASLPGRPDVDSNGNVWIPNTGNNSLTELSTRGAVLSGTGYTGGGLNQPLAIAINQISNKVWVANYNSGTVSAFDNSGNAIASGGYTSSNGANYKVTMQGNSAAGAVTVFGGDNNVLAVADTGTVASTIATTSNYGVTIDANAGIWSTQGTSANTIANTPAGSTTATTYSGGGLNVPVGIAATFAGNNWIANYGANQASLFSYTGTANASSPFTGAGLTSPLDVRVDGYNRPWFSNINGALSVLSASGAAVSGSTGYTTASTASYTTNSGLNYAMTGLQIDQAGNIWAPDRDGNLYEFVGITAPAVPVIQTLQIACGATTTYSTATGKWVTDTAYLSTTTNNAAYTEPNSPTVTYAYNNVNPAPAGVYLNERVNKGGGSFTETIPNLTPGAAYTVNLHFAELYYGSLGNGGGTGTRIFNVAINGTTVLSNFDIYAQAGGSNVGIVRAFSATADNNGKIAIAFNRGSADNPKCDGIEIVRN